MIVKRDPRIHKQLHALSHKDKAQVEGVIGLFEEYGFFLTPPYLKKLAPGLWELKSGRLRLLFGLVERDAVIVTMFLKQTQKTPLKEIRLAISRLKEYLL